VLWRARVPGASVPPAIASATLALSEGFQNR